MSKINYLDLLNFCVKERTERIAKEVNQILCLEQDELDCLGKKKTDLDKFCFTLSEFFLEFWSKLEKHPRELTEYKDFTVPQNQKILSEFLDKHHLTIFQFLTFFSYLKNHQFKICPDKTFSSTDQAFFGNLEITPNQYIALCISIPSKLFSLSFWENLYESDNEKAKQFILSVISKNKEDNNEKKLKALQKRFIALLKGEWFTYKNEEGK